MANKANTNKTIQTLSKYTKVASDEVNRVFDFSYHTIQNTKSRLQNTYLMKKTSWFRRFILKLISSNPLLRALIIYLVLLFIMSGIMMIKGLLTTNFAKSNNNNYFLSFFNVVSTITCTGITIDPLVQTYNIIGQVCLFLMMEFGGIIFTYIVSNVYLSFRGNAGNKYENQILVQIEKGEKNINTSLNMMKWNILLIGGIQLIFSLLLFVCIFYIPGYLPQTHTVWNQYYVGFSKKAVPAFHNGPMALWNAVFDSASALSNTGIMLCGSANAEVYRNGLGIIIQFFISFEFILGGIGFPLFYDLIVKLKMHQHHTKYALSLYSKLSLQAVIFVTLITTSLAYAFAYTDVSSYSIVSATNYDFNHQLNTIYSPWGQNPAVDKNWAIFFSMLNTHSAGFYDFNLMFLSTGSKWTYIVSMFIGCSPSSSAGEIKLIILLSTFYFLINRIKKLRRFNLLKKSITKAMVWNSMMILLIGILYVIIGTVVFYTFYQGPKYFQSFKIRKFTDSIFLASSVYSMCGLAPGKMFVTQAQAGYWTTLVILIASQMLLVTSIFIINKNSYTNDELRLKRMKAFFSARKNNLLKAKTKKIRQIVIV